MIKKYVIIALLISSEITLASQWDDLWLRRDQQAKKLLDQQQYQAAAERFENQDWQGAAQYRAGHFEQAAQKFERDSSARGHYNYGNALAQQGKLTDALKAYDRALKQQPNFPDAQFNRKLVEDALNKQSEKKSQENQEKKQNQNQNQNQQSESGQSKKSDDKHDHQSGSEQQKDSPKSEESPQRKNADNNNSSQHNGEKSKDQSQQKSDLNPETESEKLAKKAQDQNNPKQAQQAEEQKKPNSDQNAHSPENAQKEGEKGLSSQELSNQAQEKTDLQQWLQKIPDDPAGLLRRKFLRDHQRRQWDQQG